MMTSIELQCKLRVNVQCVKTNKVVCSKKTTTGACCFEQLTHNIKPHISKQCLIH